MIGVYRCQALPDRATVVSVDAGREIPYTVFLFIDGVAARGRSSRGIEFMSSFMIGASEALAGRNWHLIDAEGQVLGRLATLTARLLQGKHKATYTPFIDTGDFVVVVNAAKVKLTGRKEDQKIYRQHSGYEGGLREERARLVRQRKPIKLVEDAVHGMLPKTKMGEAMYRKLKVYAGPDHPHAAQKPSKREVA
jgi:large subunit ribosomal protein L13